MNEVMNRGRQTKTLDRKMAGCAGKAPYDSYADANHVARAIHSHSKKPVKPYKCQFCQKFHIGRPRPRSK